VGHQQQGQEQGSRDGYLFLQAHRSSLWTRLVTSTLFEYAEAQSLLSTTQAGFCNQKDTKHQLQNVIMSLEDAKLFKNDFYALVVDFASAFNTKDHDRMLWIMYDLGFPTDAIDMS